jgi:tagaturonate reductase
VITPPVTSTLPRLGRETLAGITSEHVVRPLPALLDLPERAVQFGTGAFLRGFVDFFLDEANRRGEFGGRVVAIGTTPSGRDVALNEQDGLYTLVVEGASDNLPARECRIISSVSRALAAQHDWQEVLAVARNPLLELVFSNTTEVGIALDADDRLDAAPPPSFPGKLTRFLLERGRAFDYADDKGVVVIPCELIERNGERLRELVLELAKRWDVEAAFRRWIERAVPFCNTLVDRIVPGKPNDGARADLEPMLGFRDELMIVAEPYRLFAIEASDAVRERLRFAAADPGVVLTDDVTPYRERKVRILNGGHTVLASVGLLGGCQTVLGAVYHPTFGPFLRRLLHDEIVPSLTAPNGEDFAHHVLERFANPYLRHALADITVQHTAKMRVRVVPSIQRYVERTGSVPPLLAFGFAAYLTLVGRAVRGDAGTPIKLGADNDGERVRQLWRESPDSSEQATRALVRSVLSDRALWQADLTSVDGFADRVSDDLGSILRQGVNAALTARLGAGSRSASSPAISLSSAP